VIAAAEAGTVYERKHGYPVKSQQAYRDVHASDFGGVIIPGGYAPDRIRRHAKPLNSCMTWRAGSRHLPRPLGAVLGRYPGGPKSHMLLRDQR